jgi:hypothetical protein
MTTQSEQQVSAETGGQAGAFNEQAGAGILGGGPEQSEQQVNDEGHGGGGQAGAFNEQAGAGIFGGPEQSEQQVNDEGHGGGGQAGAFNEQAAPVYEPPGLHRLDVSEVRGHGFVAPVQQNQQQVNDEGHGGGGQAGAFNEQAAPVYEPPVVVEPLHSEEPSYEAAGHNEDPSGLAGHDGGTDAGPEVHHA